MDLQMPVMDGYEATRKIREKEKELTEQRCMGRTPIIAMTANVFKEDVEKCLEAGMDDHVGKPIDLPALLEKLERYLNSDYTI
jgi:CheY-like chemotaxis protein